MANEPETHFFQVDLRGVIDILANHLYSTPTVFVRELLQNACDAIQMRRHETEPEHTGQITLELVEGGTTPVLTCTDDGIGLTTAEVHRFLATVGRSSKRDELFQASSDFIGQFGIGLLSCFTVSEEITLITKSAREPEAPACKWTAHADGTFQITELSEPLSPGTQVFLKAREGFGKFFEGREIERLARRWGQLLPFDITLSYREKGTTRLTVESHPMDDAEFQREKALAFGAEMFPEEGEFFDAIPLEAEAAGLRGVAYILGRPSPQARSQKHRVYLKGMLLAEENESILPPWAFFVRAVVNARYLRPTAGREDFYDDEALDDARQALGKQLKTYLLDLSRTQPEKLAKLISLHWLSFKALAAEDDDFLRTVVDWLPFHTTLGILTLPEIESAGGGAIRYAGSHEEFRQIAGVAGAQRLCVIDSSYVYDHALLKRARELTEYRVERLDTDQVLQSFSGLSLEERSKVFEFVRVADVVLQEFKCSAEVRRFKPVSVPVFFISNEAANFLKSAESAKEGSGDAMLGSVMDVLSQSAKEQAYSSVCFNLDHPQIHRLVEIRDGKILSSAVKMLYLQSLFLGQQPLTKREFDLMEDGISQFLDWGLALAAR